MAAKRAGWWGRGRRKRSEFHPLPFRSVRTDPFQPDGSSGLEPLSPQRWALLSRDWLVTLTSAHHPSPLPPPGAPPLPHPAHTPPPPLRSLISLPWADARMGCRGVQECGGYRSSLQVAPVNGAGPPPPPPSKKDIRRAALRAERGAGRGAGTTSFKAARARRDTRGSDDLHRVGHLSGCPARMVIFFSPFFPPTEEIAALNSVITAAEIYLSAAERGQMHGIEAAQAIHSAPD